MTIEQSAVSPQDRWAAAELLARYAELLDAGDFAGVGELFAAAVIVGDGGEVRATGAREIAELYERTTRRYPDGTPRTAHIITNVIVEAADDDQLEVRSRFTVHQATDRLALQPIVVGRYVDRLARRSDHADDVGEWAFASRRIEPAAWGDASQHVVGRAARPRASDVDGLGVRLDRVEAERAIGALLHRYGTALDYGDADGFAACFTDDGIFESVATNGVKPIDVRGAAALRAYAASHSSAPDRMHKHCLFGTVVAFADAGPQFDDIGLRFDQAVRDASAVSYYARLDLLVDGPVIMAFGRYHDTLTLTSDGWRLRRRQIEIEALRPAALSNWPDLRAR